METTVPWSPLTSGLWSPARPSGCWGPACLPMHPHPGNPDLSKRSPTIPVSQQALSALKTASEESTPTVCEKQTVPGSMSLSGQTPGSELASLCCPL